MEKRAKGLEVNIHILQQVTDSLSHDQIRGINDGLIYYHESIMSTKDRRALLEYWLTVARRNDSFRDWLTSQLTSIDEPKAVAALQTVVGLEQLDSIGEYFSASVTSYQAQIRFKFSLYVLNCTSMLN